MCVETTAGGLGSGRVETSELFLDYYVGVTCAVLTLIKSTEDCGADMIDLTVLVA